MKAPPRKKVSLADSAAAARLALKTAGHAPPAPGTPPAAGDLILGGGGFVDPGDRKTPHFAFARVDIAARRVGLTPTTFLPHGVAVDPLDATRVVAFEKIGPGAAEIDLASGRVTRGLSPAQGRWFYGHGAFSPDGKLLYSTETVNARERGVIGVRDAKTLSYLGEFPTFGENPHDCHLIDEGKVLVVTNGGGALGTDMRPCVTYVDVDSRRLLEKLDLESDRFNTGHLTLGGPDALVVVSAPRKGLTEQDLGAVSLRRGKERLRTMTEPADVAARMLGEALSVEIHEPTGIAAVTHPNGGMVTFWSLGDMKLVKAIDLPRPRGLALTRDGRYFVLSYAESAEVVLVDPASLEPLPQTRVSQSFLTGSHLFNWNRLADALTPRA
jgi:hypothetical protein